MDYEENNLQRLQARRAGAFGLFWLDSSHSHYDHLYDSSNVELI